MTAAKLLFALSKAGPTHIDQIHPDFHQALVDFSIADPPLVRSEDGLVEITQHGRLAALEWRAPL